MSSDEASPGSIAIGGFSLQVGGAGGVVVQQSTAPAAEGTGTLAQALEEPHPKDEGAVAAAAGTVESASDVTAKCERAVSLGKGVAEGKAFSPDQLSSEVGVLLDLLERLDRKGRHKEELRVARALATLLMLLRRWAALLQTLRTALHAAEEIGDLDAVAWAKHEIGSLRLVARDVEGAERSLHEAREIRERIGDRRGLAATNRNLGTLCECLRQMLREEDLVRPRPRNPRPMALRVLALAAVFALAFGAGVLAGNSGGSDKQAGFEKGGTTTHPNGDGNHGGQSEEEEEEEETTTTTTPTTTTTTTTTGPTKEELLKKIEDEEREAAEERRREEEAAAAAAKRAEEELEEPIG